MDAGRVLVIEDQSYLREMVVEILNEFGYAASGSDDARQALADMPRLQPDLIVLDMWMPTMNGRVFVERLRADARFTALPVIIVSGDRSIGLDTDRYPHVKFLMKPFEASALIDLARALIVPRIPASA